MHDLPHFITDPDPNLFLTDDYLVLDFENTVHDDDMSALHPENNILISVWRRRDREEIRCGNEYELSDLVSEIESTPLLVAHNAKHELQWLRRAGIDLTKVLIYDTMIGDYVRYGNQRVRLGLGKMAARYGVGDKEPFVDQCMRSGVPIDEIPTSLLINRCRRDVYQTEQIFLQQRRILAAQNKLGVMYTRCILTPVLADIEFNGMHLDPDRVRQEYDSHVARLVEVEKELDEMTEGRNMRSTKQKAEFIYDVLKFPPPKDKRGQILTTPTGNPRTDTDTVLGLKAKTKKQAHFQGLLKEYNKVSAMLSKNLEFFKGVVEEQDGIFGAVFNQTITKTHRLSSSGRPTKFKLFKKKKSTQFQNMPRTFKGLFSPRYDDWYISEIDGSQLEFRVAGYLGQDWKVQDDIENEADVHSFTASVLNAISEEEVTKDQRTAAKADTFKPLYGGQSGTPEQVKYYEAFKEKYAYVAKAQEVWKQEVLRNKQLVLPWGMEFFWPDTTISRSGYISNSTQICNFPVQSLATAEIIPIALARLWHGMKAQEMKSFLVNTVHDSAISEIHPQEKELFREIAVLSFTEYVYFYMEKVYNIQFNIQLGAGLEFGTHWSEGEEEKYEATVPYPTPQPPEETTTNVPNANAGPEELWS